MREGGKWYIYAGEYRTPSVTYTEEDLRGALNVTTHISKSDAFNTVRGTYISPSADYNETDFPSVKNDTYIAEDGVQVFEDIALGFVTSPSQAQRLAKIKLEKSRQGISVGFPATIAALQNKVGDTIYLTMPRFGWTAKIFEIVDLAFAEERDGTLGVDLELRETASGVYDYNSGEETTVDLAPNTGLPSAFDVAEPTDLLLESGTDQLDKRLDGSIFSRLKVSWTASETEFVVNGGHYEIEYKKSVDPDYRPAASVPGGNTFTYILDLKDGVLYDLRIRAVNTLNYPSDWVTQTNYLVLGKVAPPSNVTSFVGVVSDLGINFSWDDIPDIDKKEYELREGTTWDTATVIGNTQASDGSSFLYQQLTAGTHNFLIKARDTTLNYSATATPLVVTILGPNPPISFNVSTIKNNVLLDWEKPLESTLTVNKYYVYRSGQGETFGSATFIGETFGTFHTYLEKYGGAFTYWLVAADVGGNTSSEVSFDITITASDDFFINADDFLWDNLNFTEHCFVDTGAEAIYAMIGGESIATQLPLLLNPGFTSETWAEHYVSAGFSSIQDFIDAGYLYYLQPVSTAFTAQMEFLIDYTVTFGSVFVDFSWSQDDLDGTVTVVPIISVSADGVTYTDYTDTNQVFAENFRYVKYKLQVTGVDDKSISKFYNFRAVLAVQRTEETQIITANSADVGGTTVTFANEFLDVEDIQVSVNSTTDARVIYDYDFATIPAPQTMKVLVFNSAGARTTKEVSVRIRGAISG